MGDRGEHGRGRLRKPPEKPRCMGVPQYLNDAVWMVCMMESLKEGGFSDAFFYDAQKSWFESAGYFVGFEKGFNPPLSMIQYHNEVLQGKLKPEKKQPVVSIGPSRKKRLYSA